MHVVSVSRLTDIHSQGKAFHMIPPPRTFLLLLPVIVLTALACAPPPTPTPLPYVPLYTDAQVIELVRQYVRTKCRGLDPFDWKVVKHTGPREQYFVTATEDLPIVVAQGSENMSWTFIGLSGVTIPTTDPKVGYGCWAPPRSTVSQGTNPEALMVICNKPAPSRSRR
jgi:hypothetical protein